MCSISVGYSRIHRKGKFTPVCLCPARKLASNIVLVGSDRTADIGLVHFCVVIEHRSMTASLYINTQKQYELGEYPVMLTETLGQ